MTVPIEIAQLIRTSGNSFHAKVARWLTEHGWHIVVSPYYMDQSQAKARELDLIAERLWPVRDRFARRSGNLVVRLFIECKFVATDAVFWFAPKNRVAAEELLCSIGPFTLHNYHNNSHHYISSSPSVAKLFASNNSKLAENEPFYKALNQVLNAKIAFRSQSPTLPDLKGWEHADVTVIDYPVVVCSSFSRMYAAQFLDETDPKAIADNFQMEVQYAYQVPNRDGRAREHNDYFLIDFVEFGQLEGFTANIDVGANAACEVAAQSL